MRELGFSNCSAFGIVAINATIQLVHLISPQVNFCLQHSHDIHSKGHCCSDFCQTSSACITAKLLNTMYWGNVNVTHYVQHNMFILLNAWISSRLYGHMKTFYTPKVHGKHPPRQACTKNTKNITYNTHYNTKVARFLTTALWLCRVLHTRVYMPIKFNYNISNTRLTGILINII